MWHVSIGTGEHLTLNCPDITFSEKTNKVVYLIYVGIPKWGNLQTSYTNNEKVCRIKHLSETTAASRSGVDLSCNCICSRSHVSLTALCPQLTRLYMAIQRTVTLNICMFITIIITFGIVILMVSMKMTSEWSKHIAV
jgi:hypothetical protein